MNNSVSDHLKTLHTKAVDARAGYLEALNDAEGRGMTALFQEMIAIHSRNANELAIALTNLGEKPDESGSFMATVHRTVMSIRSLFGGLDKRVLPGLIDGEQRNVSAYDEALQLPDLPPMTRTRIDTQRKRLVAAIDSMHVHEMVKLA